MNPFPRRKVRRVVASHELAGFHRWVLSLPWVVERPPDVRWPGVRLFAVDCEPLDRRQVWLVTGLAAGDDVVDSDRADIAVVLPLSLVRSDEPDDGGTGSAVPVSSVHMLVPISRGALSNRAEVEAFVFEAYDCDLCGDGWP